jgi:hypothetical protein
MMGNAFVSSRFHVFCCARSSDIDSLDTNLKRSPEIASGEIGVTILWNQQSAASAYSRAAETANAEILVFAHCDVYFPEGWFKRLAWEVDRLAQIDSNWAVAGIISKTASNELVGRIFDTSLEPVFRDNLGVFGKSLTVPIPIVSADELALVVQRAAGVSFDPLLPEFHLYGTDIVLAAEKAGKRAYGLDMPLIHNAKPQLRLGPDYGRAYRYMVRKWRDRLPVPTTCGPLTANPFSLFIRRTQIRFKAMFRPTTYSTLRLTDPAAKALELGFTKDLVAPMLKTASKP